MLRKNIWQKKIKNIFDKKINSKKYLTKKKYKKNTPQYKNNVWQKKIPKNIWQKKKWILDLKKKKKKKTGEKDSLS